MPNQEISVSVTLGAKRVILFGENEQQKPHISTPRSMQLDIDRDDLQLLVNRLQAALDDTKEVASNA